mmetsp:Transcript_24862/g.98266  ORF Transcript_24862/g.98266 Transcript_24862/m.98266 type:complete len:83 (+) Transcript_24862:1055-1303(+)
MKSGTPFSFDLAPFFFFAVSYKSFGFALRTIARREGWRGFYKGLTANLLRVTPSAAITFIVYEQSMKSLGNLKPIEMTSGTA